jgi:hypothetical protein
MNTLNIPMIPMIIPRLFIGVLVFYTLFSQFQIWSLWRDPFPPWIGPLTVSGFLDHFVLYTDVDARISWTLGCKLIMTDIIYLHI